MIENNEKSNHHDAFLDKEQIDKLFQEYELIIFLLSLPPIDFIVIYSF